MNARQIGEFEARDFLGEDFWKACKRDYDECMAYRKTIKGKPTEEQLAVLKMNARFIEFYGSILFHSVTLANRDLCACTSCGQKRSCA